MNQSYTPLRYPGGKAAIIQMMIDTIILNKLQLYHYAEPFAGGCGLALGLLMRGYVSHIHFNDTATTEIYTLSLHDALPIFHQYAVP